MKRQALPGIGEIAEDGPGPRADGTRHTLTYGQYRLSYEVYGSGDRVLVWMHGLLLDANLSRGLARRLAAKGNRVILLDLLSHGRSDKRPASPHRDSDRLTHSSVPPRPTRTKPPPCCTASCWGPSLRPSTSAGPSPRRRWSWDMGST